MCFITLKETQKLIATEDMIVYKKLDQRFDFEGVPVGLHAVSHPFKYGEFGEVHVADITPSDSDACFDQRDTNYLNELCGGDPSDGGYQWQYPEHEDKFISYGSGFHSAMTLKRLGSLYDGYGNVIVECTIPKGSEYMTRDELVISNQIILNKILE